MRFMGGKHRLAARIVDVIARDAAVREITELFTGAANVTAALAARGFSVTTVEKDVGLFDLWSTVSRGEWEPPDVVSEEDYRRIKASGKSGRLEAFVGFGCSFAGRLWEGYARDASGTNYAARAKRGVLKKAAAISAVRFVHADAMTYAPETRLVYADPPYAGTTQSFAHKVRDFWPRAEELAAEGHTVYVSEYSAPPSAELVAEWPCLRGQPAAGKTEKLFVMRPGGEE